MQEYFAKDKFKQGLRCGMTSNPPTHSIPLQPHPQMAKFSPQINVNTYILYMIYEKTYLNKSTFKSLFSPCCFVLGRRKIRVFITYSQDDKHHTQRVINLCDCLRKNNFQPCIDMFDKAKLAEDKHGWIDKKFREVTYIYAREIYELIYFELFCRYVFMGCFHLSSRGGWGWWWFSRNVMHAWCTMGKITLLPIFRLPGKITPLQPPPPP